MQFRSIPVHHLQTCRFQRTQQIGEAAGLFVHPASSVVQAADHFRRKERGSVSEAGHQPFDADLTVGSESRRVRRFVEQVRKGVEVDFGRDGPTHGAAKSVGGYRIVGRLVFGLKEREERGPQGIGFQHDLTTAFGSETLLDGTRRHAGSLGLTGKQRGPFREPGSHLGDERLEVGFPDVPKPGLDRIAGVLPGEGKRRVQGRISPQGSLDPAEKMPAQVGGFGVACGSNREFIHESTQGTKPHAFGCGLKDHRVRRANSVRGRGLVNQCG